MLITQRDKEQEKAWRYVGRFMWSFANVEASVDNIFEVMFNLNAISYSLLHNSLDLRKKVKLIQLGFKHQGIDHGKTLNRVQELADIRNFIAHSSFEPVPAFERLENGVQVRYEEGIDFSLPKPARKQKELLLESTITYSEFDEYDAQASKLMQTLVEIGGFCEPINEGINFVRDIAEIVASSDNVVPFRKPAPKA